MRTKNSTINLVTALAGQAIGLIISFIARIVFVRYLSAEYLGLNGLFTNLLTMLSLVELGVGPAMTYSLYKPLADNDTEKIKSLMKLYKKIYIIIGITILILGISFVPFYRFFINKVPDITNLDLIYLLFVINTAISYFYSYKRDLIICDQKRYIATIYRYSFYCILNLLQIVVLCLTSNYILFLVLQVLCTWLENIFISLKADRMFPYLREKNVKQISKKEINLIKKNVLAMMFHKMGGAVVNSTDNIIMSTFVGLVSVGIYSNYYLVIYALETIINQVFNSIVASVGNLGASDNKEKVYEIFKITRFINYMIFSVIFLCLYFLVNDFIKIWLGQKYLFGTLTVLIICVSFYLKGMRKTVLVYKDALGLFWYDRYKPILESIINLVVSIILAVKFGVLGIFLGTIISTLTTSIWIEPFVLYKYYFKKSFSEYMFWLFRCLLLTVITFLILIYPVSMFEVNNLFIFLIKAVMIFVFSILLSILPFLKSDELKGVIQIVNRLVRTKDKNKL